jgi:hypothetical protein
MVRYGPLRHWKHDTAFLTETEAGGKRGRKPVEKFGKQALKEAMRATGA